MNEIQRLIHEMCPDGVPMVALGEICTLLGGGTPSKSHPEYYEGNIPWATVSDMNCKIINDTILHINDLAIKESSTNLIHKNNVIISTHVGVGKVCWLSKDTAINQDLKAVLPKDDAVVDKRFLFYWFESEADYFLNNARGGTVKGVTVDFVLRTQIPLPPLPIQQRIVEILDKFTSLVSSLDSEIALRQKQYEYYRNKLLSFEEGEEGVEWKKLSDVCIVINGRAYKQSELLDKGPYRVLRVGNFFSNDSWYYSDLELESKYYCVNGDLLYAWSASFGPHIWKEEKVIYHYHIWKLECQEPLDKKFMFYWLQSDNMTSQVSSEKHGATMAHLTKAMMEDLILPIPSLDRQRSIVRTLDTFESLLTNLKKERELRQKQYEYYREKLLTFA